MKVFLSWSGQRSKSVAHSLRDWMPLILHYVEPWLSQQDISAGDRWSVQVGHELSESNFGIICLTPENLTAPWILFESGAISKSFSAGAVCPYLYDVEFSAIVGPLSQFQGKKADYRSTKELIESINAKASTPIESNRLDKLYNTFWPDLEEMLNNIPDPNLEAKQIRPQAEILEELVGVVRSLEARFRQYETVFPVSEDPSIKFAISSDGTVETSLPKGEKLMLVGPPSRIIVTVATRMGISAEGYGSDWHFEDCETKGKLHKREDVLELGKKYRGRVCSLEITNFPF
jgi:hypothetical protein